MKYDFLKCLSRFWFVVDKQIYHICGRPLFIHFISFLIKCFFLSWFCTSKHNTIWLLFFFVSLILKPTMVRLWWTCLEPKDTFRPLKNLCLSITAVHILSSYYGNRVTIPRVAWAAWNERETSNYCVILKLTLDFGFTIGFWVSEANIKWTTSWLSICSKNVMMLESTR